MVSAQAKSASNGMKKYWVKVEDGKVERPVKYDLTLHDREVDSKNGKKAIKFRMKRVKKSSKKNKKKGAKKGRK